MKTIILLASIVLLLLSSCVTQKGVDHYYSKNPELEQLKAQGYMASHAGLLAQMCTEKFPVKERIGKSDTVFRVDTIPGVQAECPDGTKITCPPSLDKTQTIRDTIYLKDAAELEAARYHFANALKVEKDAYQEEYKNRIKAETERDELAKKYKNAYLLLMAAGAVIVLLGFLYFKIK